ncbi:MAG: hypothetical protein WB791_11080 [Waddliaceae bacterium]
MKKNQQFNIFGEAPKKVKKKKTLTPSSSSAAEPVIEKKTQPTSSGLAGITTDEPEEMLKRIHKMDDDLENKMTRVCELSGMSRKEVHDFIENPDNFTVQQWKKAQEDKSAIEEKIYAIFGAEQQNIKAEKKKKKISKKRRGKTLGARKGWLQM